MKKLLASLLFTAVVGFATTGTAGVLTLGSFGGLALEDTSAITPTPSSIIAPLTYNGTTTGGPTFNRPNVTGTAAPTTLSTVGTAVPYDVVMFTVATSGTYNFLSTSTTTGYDNFTLLYSGIFNASTPLVGVLQGNDDIVFGVTSGFSRALTAGTQYSFVTTGYANTNFGTFTDSITLSPVPEPSTWAMMSAGLVGLVVVQRLRRRTA